MTTVVEGAVRGWKVDKTLNAGHILAFFTVMAVIGGWVYSFGAVGAKLTDIERRIASAETLISVVAEQQVTIGRLQAADLAQQEVLDRGRADRLAFQADTSRRLEVLTESVSSLSAKVDFLVRQQERSTVR